jgi:large subunit ribosomal protein L7/L12
MRSVVNLYIELGKLDQYSKTAGVPSEKALGVFQDGMRALLAEVSIAAGQTLRVAGGSQEPSTFTVQLDGHYADKVIHVIKVVHEITGLSLKEVKDLVVGAPKPVKENVSRGEAEALKKKLEDAGARVSLPPSKCSREVHEPGPRAPSGILSPCGATLRRCTFWTTSSPSSAMPGPSRSSTPPWRARGGAFTGRTTGSSAVAGDQRGKPHARTRPKSRGVTSAG